MKVYKTNPRPQVRQLDVFPMVDRSLINYDEYHKFIGQAGVKHSMAVQATRGCPYKCFFCGMHKTARLHCRRAIKRVFDEVKLLAGLGIKRIVFIDDNFNVDKEDFISFFELVIKQSLKLEFFFPTGLKGDALSKDMIDLMIEAGTVGASLSLEHASSRLQKVMRKNLNVEKLRENLQYIAEKYPFFILGLNAMHGFPTETEEEAMMTLNYIKSIRWIHFPYLHNVIVFSGTELERFALDAGIPKESIEQSQDMSYHEFPFTLPFSHDFTRKIRMKFLREYVLNKERLLHVLPYQLEQFTEDELNQKYNSYFPTKINSLDDLLGIARIDRFELRPRKVFKENQGRVQDLKNRISKEFPAITKKEKTALKLMLIDLSTYFVNDTNYSEYAVLEPPMGLMMLLTYLNQEFGGQVEGRIYKSRIDFNSYEELCKLIDDFNPDIIGVRTITFYKKFFQEAIAHIRKCGITAPIIAGGPYATVSYADLLQDRNINLAVIGEGEITLAEIIKKMLTDNNCFPDKDTLKKIPGIAFLGG